MIMQVVAGIWGCGGDSTGGAGAAASVFSVLELDYNCTRSMHVWTYT